MTNMEILQLADQCGVIAVTKHEWDGKRFNHTDDYLDGDGAGLVIFAKAIAEREREACAKIVENRILHDKNENIKKGYFYAQQSITQDIRARGQE